VRTIGFVGTILAVLCTGTFISTNADGSPRIAPPTGPTPVPCQADALIAAIKSVNAAGGGSLNLAAGCTYTLESAQPNTIDGLPPITAPITINGNNATITRSSNPSTPAFRIFEVPSQPGALTIRALTVSNGHTTGPDNGAGIFAHDGGSVDVNRSRLTRNTADFRGGGIFNDKATVRIDDSAISNNTAFTGGGIDNEDGGLTVSRTLLADNTISEPAGGGGALFNLLGTVTLSDDTVSGNSGDAIANFEHLTIRNTNIKANTGRAGAGINNVGDLEVTHSLLVQNRTTELGGGGLINFRIAGILGTAKLADTIVADNTAATSGGGIFVDGGTVELTRSPVTGNHAATAPGGITNDNGEVTLNASPVTRNTPTNCAGSPTPVPGCVN
jgi:predicted outer membrane repeat protein